MSSNVNNCSASAKTISFHQNKVLFKNFFELKELQVKHSLYRGGESAIVSREVFCRKEAVVVFLYDLKLKQVVLVEQFRAGAAINAISNGKHENAWLLEPVAGMIDQGESALQAGIREAKEETGIDIHSLEYISQFYPSPGACDEILHLYAADIDSSKVDTHAGLVDESEDIKVVVMSFDEAKAKLLNADFNVASTFIALQWLFFQKLTNNT